MISVNLLIRKEFNVATSVYKNGLKESCFSLTEFKWLINSVFKSRRLIQNSTSIECLFLSFYFKEELPAKQLTSLHA